MKTEEAPLLGVYQSATKTPTLPLCTSLHPLTHHTPKHYPSGENTHITKPTYCILYVCDIRELLATLDTGAELLATLDTGAELLATLDTGAYDQKRYIHGYPEEVPLQCLNDKSSSHPSHNTPRRVKSGVDISQKCCFGSGICENPSFPLLF